MVELSYEASFRAEHQAPGYPPHEHGFRLRVTISGDLAAGVVFPFEHLRAAVTNLLRVIECVPPTEAMPGGSSVEQMAVWIWGELARGLPSLRAVELGDGAFIATYRGRA
jgi:6-pyruvoyl-tetrahydropterin synthase